MKLNDAGRMIEKWWLGLMNKCSSVGTDEYVVMPNHFHGILTIVGADLRVRPDPGPIHPGQTCPNLVGPGLISSSAGGHICPPLPKITMVQKRWQRVE